MIMSIYYKEGFGYQTTAPHAVQTGIRQPFYLQTPDGFLTLHPDGWLFVTRGYSWDGPSGPCKFLSQLPGLGRLYRRYCLRQLLRGSLVHDALYQLIRAELLPPTARAAADTLFRRILIEDGVSWLRAWWIFQGVRRFASYAASPRNKKPVLEAPKPRRPA